MEVNSYKEVGGHTHGQGAVQPTKGKSVNLLCEVWSKSLNNKGWNAFMNFKTLFYQILHQSLIWDQCFISKAVFASHMELSGAKEQILFF